MAAAANIKNFGTGFCCGINNKKKGKRGRTGTNYDDDFNGRAAEFGGPTDDVAVAMREADFQTHQHVEVANTSY
ncbi:hypothetical protein QYF36_008503 [Acer negundo]|nr:hypothetical protein QYF36_008503 [Acer negundo]